MPRRAGKEMNETYRRKKNKSAIKTKSKRVDRGQPPKNTQIPKNAERQIEFSEPVVTLFFMDEYRGIILEVVVLNILASE